MRRPASASLRRALERDFRRLQRGPLAPVEVCVLDTGVDATHPALRGRVREAFAVNTAGGRARVTPGPVPRNADLLDHGTAVAGIVAGVAPNARIVDVRVLGPRTRNVEAALLAGFEHAVSRRYRILNVSLAAGAALAEPLRALCERAYRQNQVVVAARRNMPIEDDGFPAELPICIGVDAESLASPLDVRFRPDHVVEYGGGGDDVVVAAAGGGRTRRTGSSYAAPVVAGLCALLVGAHPDLRPFELKALLKAFGV